jgi:hypothetical protein
MAAGRPPMCVVVGRRIRGAYYSPPAPLRFACSGPRPIPWRPRSSQRPNSFDGRTLLAAKVSEVTHAAINIVEQIRSAQAVVREYQRGIICISSIFERVFAGLQRSSPNVNSMTRVHAVRCQTARSKGVQRLGSQSQVVDLSNYAQHGARRRSANGLRL